MSIPKSVRKLLAVDLGSDIAVNRDTWHYEVAVSLPIDQTINRLRRAGWRFIRGYGPRSRIQALYRDVGGQRARVFVCQHFWDREDTTYLESWFVC